MGQVGCDGGHRDKKQISSKTEMAFNNRRMILISYGTVESDVR